MLLACGMLSQCSKLQNGRVSDRQTNIRTQVENLQVRMENYSVMRADGDLSREEYQHLRKDATSAMQKLKAELDELDAPVTPDYSNQLKKAQKAMEQMVDFSRPKVPESLIQKFVGTITPSEQYTYRWKLNFALAQEGDNRTNLMKTATFPVLTFTINFEDAQSFRQTNGVGFRFCRSQWHNLMVEVYL